ncbi:hypothetical protein PVAP13_5KG106200 [Panicum virgatum]|uniref:Uncharacterized protein n=1 Tax=Panicum virgatum TaxID=38727 RepID=A0A8T0SAH2_PANVG|nr:hypothetical protein PVAP13_5KG106200 [Panicum virgatum]
MLLARRLPRTGRPPCICAAPPRPAPVTASQALEDGGGDHHPALHEAPHRHKVRARAVRGGEQEVVDILFSLLALPVATAVTLVETDYGHRGAGSVGNLFASAEKLGYAYIQPGAAKDKLPRPTPSLLLMPASSFEPSRIFFRCHYNYSYHHRGGQNCGSYMTDARGTRCPNCTNEMTAKLHYVSPAWSGLANPSQILEQSTSSDGSTAAATYTVLDDLTITPHAPMTAISSVAQLGSLGVTDLAALQERTVRLRYNEGLAILKASMHSKTVLTDVFLGDRT